MDAILFDLDGTLVDTEILWVKATEQWAAQHALHLSHDEALRLVYGRAWPASQPDLLDRLDGLPR